jgi:site-specific recombinase XerD
LDLLHRSWMRALKARNLADKTLRIHGDSLTALVDHADAAQLGDLDRDAVRAFLADLTDRFAPATVSVRYRALQQFFKWCVAEEELDRSPMDAMQAPVVPEQPVDVLPTADARDLLKVQGHDVRRPPRHRDHPAVPRHRHAVAGARRSDRRRPRHGRRRRLRARQGPSPPRLCRQSPAVRSPG